MQAKLYGRNFEITDEMLTAGKFMTSQVIPIAEKSVDGIADIYKSYENLENVAENLMTAKDELYLTIASKYVQLLQQYNLRDYDYSAEDFLADYYSVFKNSDLDKLCKIIINSYNNLANKKISAEYKRDFRKATRSKMYGTTLGTSAVAGTFNLLNYAAHSIFNAVDGAITNSNIDENMNHLYEEYESEVYECAYSDAYNMGILFCVIAGLDDFYIKNWKKAVNIQRAIDKGEVPKNKLQEKVAEVLFLQPQEKDNYIWAFKLLGDDNFKLIEYAELFEQKAAVAEMQKAMAEAEIQKKKKQQELKLKAEKVMAANQRRDELKSLSKKMFGDNAAEMDSRYASNRFYSIFLETDGGIPSVEFWRKMYQSLEKFSKYTKYIWSREVYHFDGKLNSLKESFKKFKVTPPPDSEVIFLVCCDEYFSAILFTGQKIYFVPLEEKPLEYSLDEIKNFQFVRKEGVMTYHDYITVNGKNIMTADFDDEVFKAVKDILEIFKLKNSYFKPKNIPLETAPQISLTEFKANLRDTYKFNSHIYYNFSNDDKAQKKFRAAVDSYAKISSNEEPVVLYDSTLFGSAKDGFLLTSKGIYSHGIGIEKNFIPYENLGVAQISQNNNKIIKINNSFEVDTVNLSDGDIDNLVKLIRSCREYFTTQKNINPAPPKISPPVEIETASTWEEWADKKNIETPININRDIKIFVKQLQEKYKFSHDIYFNDFSNENTKPQKKIKAAVKSYADLVKGETALICCDSTLFGGGDEGFLVTNRGVHSKSSWYKKTFIGYVDNKLEVSQNKKHVVLNSVVELDTGTFSAEEKQALINLINECKKYFS